MNYFIQYRQIDNRYYFIKLLEREPEDYNNKYEIKISQEIYDDLKDKIKNIIFNNFSTSRYYSLSEEIKTIEDVLYDDTKITDINEINNIKQNCITDITQNFLPKIYNMIPNIINIIFQNNQILLANNYIITEENKEEKINEIILNGDEKIIDALINFTSKMEEYNKIISILQQSSLVIDIISKSSDIEKIENNTNELLQLLDSNNEI